MKNLTGLKTGGVLMNSREELIKLVADCSMHFFDKRKHCCSESIMLVFTSVFPGSLSPDDAVRLGSGLCQGIGGAGCICGALGCSVMLLGYYLGPDQPAGVSRRKLKSLSEKMHNRFKNKFKSTCCRVLTKNVKNNRKAHHENCKKLTGTAAEILTDIVLKARPELEKSANFEYLSNCGSKKKGLFNKMLVSLKN